MAGPVLAIRLDTTTLDANQTGWHGPCRSGSVVVRRGLMTHHRKPPRSPGVAADWFGVRQIKSGQERPVTLGKKPPQRSDRPIAGHFTLCLWPGYAAVTSSDINMIHCAVRASASRTAGSAGKLRFAASRFGSLPRAVTIRIYGGHGSDFRRTARMPNRGCGRSCQRLAPGRFASL